MLATMYLNQMDTTQRLQGSFAGSFIPLKIRKNLLALLSIMLLTIGSSLVANAQVLQASYSPEVVCEGNNAIINFSPPVGLPAGTTVVRYIIYFQGSIELVDSAVTNPPFQFQIPVRYTPGYYHPYVIAELSDLSRIKSNVMDLTVYHKPIPYFVNLTADVQCQKGNNVCLQNASMQAPQPSSPIVQYVWEYGDALSDSLTSPVDVCHTYDFDGTFTVALRAIDSLGCRKDTFSPPNNPIRIKPALTPKFSWVQRTGPCDVSNYLFTNATPVSIDALISYRWEFGDDSSYEATAPFTPRERAFFDSIGHDYTVNGEFPPFISVTDTTGCTDSIRYTQLDSNIPRNIVFSFDVVTVASPVDAASRDSVCVGSGNAATVCFKQTPIKFAGQGDFLWRFDDPFSMDKNVDFVSWNPCHTFVGNPATSPMGTYYVTLSISNVCPGKVITHTYTAGRTLYDNKYIDKYINNQYVQNDLTDVESRPIMMLDTVTFPLHKKPYWNLVYLNEFNTSVGDTLYAYKRVDVERPIFYLGDSIAIDSNGMIKDSILLKPNFMRVDSFNVFDSAGTVIQDTMRYDTTAGYISYGYGVRVIGPFARIEQPPAAVVAPNQKNQCGPVDTVKFVNTSLYYKSRKMYRRWDFGDDFAPQCTSFSVPKFGFPPVVGTKPTTTISFDNGKTFRVSPADTIRKWASAEQQFANSDFYFINNGVTYEGKMNCKFSYDTLPNHHYPNWDTVSRWYKGGKDFMPWDPTLYGPAGTRPVHPNDAYFWNKPVFLNPETGEWSLIQGSGPAPFGSWTRIDTMEFGLNDLAEGAPITIRNLPDPFRSGLVDDKGKYNMIPGGSVEPTNDVSYYDKTRDETYIINGADVLPNSTMTFYEYAFMRTIVKCITVTLKLHDSLNNETTKGITLDETKLDAADCNMEATLQLSLSRADAHGLGKSGKECPGRDPNGVVFFELGELADFPGTKPECGQTFILMNFDSLADRLDNTPCALDGFVTYTGGTTAGGLNFPPFFATPNYQPMPWTSPSGTRIAWHYGMNAPANRPPPADTAQGFISVGVIIGSGCKDTTFYGEPLDNYYTGIAYWGDAQNEGTIIPNINVPVQYASNNVPVPGANLNYDYKFSQLKNYRDSFILGNLKTIVDIEYTDCSWPRCLSDTVWYHRFLRIQNLTSRFVVEPFNCRLRHVGDEITVYYEDSVQDNIKYSVYLWGDETATVDSFYYAPGGQNISDGYFTNGFRRVRYNFDLFSGIPQLIDSTEWPIRSSGPGVPGLMPRILADTVLAPNFPKIYNVLDRTSIPDSIIIQDRCFLNIDTIANADTMQYYPISQIIDTALMFLPVKHKFVRTSWDAAGRGENAAIGNLIHFIGSMNDCSQGSSMPMVIGIIDTFAINNGDGKRDTLYCQDEPIYFVDSIRYWRGDCSRTTLPMNPAITMSPAGWFVLDNAYASYQFDSADFWRQDVGDPRVIQDIVTKAGYQGRNTVDTVVAERVYWDFGDGSPIDSSMRPMHRYKSYGRYTVTMVTKDSLRGYDTCYGYLNISVPVAKIGFLLDNMGLPKDVFNCGDFADMMDSSVMDDATILAGLDSVKTNYWWFGDKPFDTITFQARNNFFPKHPYRTNGSFKVKLVSESFLGCRDTTYDTVFIRGPRPMYRPGDTIGCVPFTVTIYNMADSTGKYVDPNGNTFPSDTPTLTTYFDWGDGVSPQTIVTGRRDTVQFTYTKPGIYEIYAYGSDAVPGGQNSCDLVVYPDTNARPKITVRVVELKHKVTVDKEVVCKDPELTESSEVTISNTSDPAYFKDYSYYVQRIFDSTNVDTTVRALMPDNFTQTFPDTGYYRVIAMPDSVLNNISVEMQANCKVPDTVNVRVVSPYPSFEIDTMLTPKFVMTNTSDTSLNNRYEWVTYKQGTTVALFSSSGTNKNPDFTFDLQNDTGTFVVCLTAFATGISVAEACADSVCQTVKNNFNVRLEIPNVFSPNDDGKNDVVRIPHESVEKFKMTIYNRWGAKVFETTDVEKYWNGKVHNEGAESPAGTYYYIAEYKLRNQKDENRTGTITLIR